MSGIVIVGAGLGGLRAAESARTAGYQGPITMIGDEPHLPYTRPPLSKEALAAGIDVAALEFRRKSSIDDVAWLLHHSVVGSDLAEHEVHLDDGRALSFEALVVASCIRPRRLPLPGLARWGYVLRTADDAARLRERLTPGARVVVLGSGFIGCVSSDASGSRRFPTSGKSRRSSSSKAIILAAFCSVNNVTFRSRCARCSSSLVSRFCLIRTMIVVSNAANPVIPCSQW